MIERVSIIGIGKLGLCMSLSLEAAGFSVLGLDINQEYVDSLNNKTFRSFEPLVNERLEKAENFKATLNFEETLGFSNLVFVVVATPSLPNGRYNHSQINAVVDRIISFGFQEQPKHLVINCTTMPGFCERTSKKLEPFNWTVSYNPEFIAQGTVIKNQESPDMVLIGHLNEPEGDLIEFVYNKMTKNNPRVYRMTPTEAEICKISMNCFMTTKIAYTNMIGDIVRESGGDPQVVLDAIAGDTRVGRKLTRYGYGYGGPCFPRDNRALGIYARDLGLTAPISQATDSANNNHLDYQVKEFLKTGRKELNVFSVTYKPGSVLIEESQQLLYCVKLAKSGIKTTITERPEVIEAIKKEHGNLFVYGKRK